jgi:hypothetical protein
MCGGLTERRLDEALSAHLVSNGGHPYQHAVDIRNGIYVDEDQKDHEIVDLLQIKQKPSEPVYSLIERFEKQCLRAEDMDFEPNYVITRKTFMDGLLPNIRGKLQEGARSRTYQEAKRRAKEVVGPDGHLLKSNGEESLNLQIQLLQEELLEIKRSNAELVDAFKRMTVSQKIESSAKAIEANPSAGPPTTLSLRSRNRNYCDFCKMEGHTEEYCWRKHPEKRHVSLAQMSVDNTSSKIVQEIRGILHENEKKLPSLVKGILKEVVKKQKKKEKESCINMMSYPHAQDFLTLKMKSMMLLLLSRPRSLLVICCQINLQFLFNWLFIHLKSGYSFIPSRT